MISGRHLEFKPAGQICLQPFHRRAFNLKSGKNRQFGNRAPMKAVAISTPLECSHLSRQTNPRTPALRLAPRSALSQGKRGNWRIH